MQCRVHAKMYMSIEYFITLQGKSEHSDWFFLGLDFAIWTVSMEMVETVIGYVIFDLESRQIRNKHDPSAI